ncbi:MAG: hypothetical protein JKY22_04150 [Flavobacteriaceae bacterium]|nr:hypothetical protein [Flavobacteriaceae bacterium]
MEQDNFINDSLERYLNDQMTPEEKAQFEKEIDQSSELQELIELHEQVTVLDDEADWITYKGDVSEIKKKIPLFENEETKAFSKKLREFQNNQMQTTGRKPIVWKRLAVFSGVAASILLVLFFTIQRGDNLDQLYVAHSNWNELPSLTVKGNSVSDRTEIEQLFILKKYTEVVSNVKKITINSEEKDATLLLYQGVSQLELDQYENALQTFTELTKSNTIDHHKGYWYIAMVYLKQGNKETLIESLEVITSNSTFYKHTDASDILKKLK